MDTVRLASFGIRGHVGTSLTPREVMDFASAFATFVEGGRVLVGRDTRYSSPMIHSAVTSSLMSAGCEVLDLGICPTPILQFAVERHEAAGALSISGGHDGMGWNALTLINRHGAYMEPLGGESVLDIYHAGDFLRQQWDGMGSSHTVDNFIEPYFDAMEQAINIDAIRKAGFTVLIDPVGGAGCPYIDDFARHLGLTLVPINAEPSGYLAREPEPRPRAATQMASIIQHVKGDVGFLLSSDMTRLSVVTEKKEPASEEYTFALVANHILSKATGAVVTNCCTTRTIDDIAALKKARVVKCPVGQAYIMSTVADEQAVLGGEGSGCAAMPSFSPAFDGFLVMGLILEAMAENKSTVSDLLKALPRYHIVKKSVACETSSMAYHVLDSLKDHMAGLTDEKPDSTDGIRVDWDDGWLHVRASRTQQMVRVISEATRKDVAEQRAANVIRRVSKELEEKPE